MSASCAFGPLKVLRNGSPRSAIVACSSNQTESAFRKADRLWVAVPIEQLPGECLADPFLYGARRTFWERYLGVVESALVATRAPTA